MRRLLLQSRISEDRGDDGIDTTPLRATSFRAPRLRLLDKDIKSEEVARNQISNYQSAIPKAATQQIVKTYPQPLPKGTDAADRFILSRYEYNAEAANYLLTKKNDVHPKKNQLDVFNQANSLTVTWRKKFMHQLIVKENIIPGLRQKQVLRGSQLTTENKLPGNFAGLPKDLWDEEYFEDGMWKSKPRKRPLIGTMDSILDMPGFQPMPRLRFLLIDWSSTNIIAAAVRNHITFYDTRLSYPMELAPLERINAFALKWSNAGDKLVICTISSSVCVYVVETQKIIWRAKCKCLLKYNTLCFIRCVCWSQNDQHVVTGCKGIISIYLSDSGILVNTLICHTTSIIALSFSPDYRYLVSTAPDTSVCIFLWPTLNSLLDITYYEPVKALAWHPQESALLCIGGGVGDASLSLWNVNKLDPIAYRRVHFHGGVDNLAWNKISGELVVHWSYWRARRRHTIIPILASLDRVVDTVPVDKESRITYVMWNSDHTQLATQSEDSLSIWNFFGNDYHVRQNRKKSIKNKNLQKEETNGSSKAFRHFNIR